MEEKDAVDLLNRLEKFMIDTNEAVKNLIIKTHNLQVDIDGLKKQLNTNRILVRN